MISPVCWLFFILGARGGGKSRLNSARHRLISKLVYSVLYQILRNYNILRNSDNYQSFITYSTEYSTVSYDTHIIISITISFLLSGTLYTLFTPFFILHS